MSSFSVFMSAERNKAAAKEHLPWHEQPLWLDDMGPAIDRAVREHKRAIVERKKEKMSAAPRSRP